MKFSTAILSAALVLSASSSSYAFTAQRSLTRTAIVRSTASSRLSSSTPQVEPAEALTPSQSTNKDDDTIATIAAANGLNDTSSSLSPEFQAACDAAISKLTASLPNPALEKPLTHFMTEYFGALDTAAKAGNKNADGSDITPQQAMKEMGTTLQYGMKYGLGAGPKGKFIFEDVRHMAFRGDVEHDERYKSEELKKMLGDDINVDSYAAGCNFFRPAIDLEK